MLQLQPNTTHDNRQFRRLCDTVYRHCGILLNESKRELVHARVARQLRTRPHVSLGEYLDEVLADQSGEEFASLIDALSTNLTSFNRESAHFRYLTTTLLPKLLERKRREKSRSIRAWSAACSSGEEPYTLAMTMADALRDAGPWDTLILATDISRNVLRTASAGRYPADRLKTLPPGVAERHFAAVPGHRELRQVSPEIRAMIRFNYLNLMEPWPFAGPF
ncbi:chemotaxis protein CheR, partial [bacterium]